MRTLSKIMLLAALTTSLSGCLGNPWYGSYSVCLMGTMEGCPDHQP